MKFRKMIVFMLILAIALLSISPALAQEPEPELSPCPTGNVSGTVVAVDPETGVVTVQLTDGSQCTVTINMDDIDPEGMHPIVYLLGKYFRNPTPAELQEAVSTVQGCAVDNEDETWSWADCEDEGAVPVRVTSSNNGTFTAVYEVDGTWVEIQLLIVDEIAAGQVRGALDTLIVAWTVGENGSLPQVSEQIAAYHDEGMGFGVLVKLYAIAQESVLCQQTSCTVDELVDLFQTGEGGMGQIFKDYGKPSKLGVGHVRQAMAPDKEKGKDKDKGGDEQPGDDQSGDDSQALSAAANKKNDKPLKDNNNGLKGICNAVEKGGKPKAGINCGP